MICREDKRYMFKSTMCTPGYIYFKNLFMWRHMYLNVYESYTHTTCTHMLYEMCVLVLLVLTHWDPHYVHIHVYSIVTHYLHVCVVRT